jgi:hypothetical protein
MAENDDGRNILSRATVHEEVDRPPMSITYVDDLVVGMEQNVEMYDGSLKTSICVPSISLPSSVGKPLLFYILYSGMLNFDAVPQDLPGEKAIISKQGF